jgi:hypothetical protein
MWLKETTGISVHKDMFQRMVSSVIDKNLIEA